MNYLRDNKSWNEIEEENLNWETIKISKVNDKIIEMLLNNLKLDLSDDFFISFESLLKLGEKSESQIISILSEMDEIRDFKKHLFKFILDFIQNKKNNYYLVPQLFNPDFIVRARTIMKIESLNETQKYFKFILPLLSDPDDSVRYSALKTIKSLLSDPDDSVRYSTLKMIKSKVYKKLQYQSKHELNKKILIEIKKILKKIEKK